jgi:multiple inositol-polyphosphate phosphatase/2,3-bisphosphoglycerate 3-phosphatase
LTADGKLLEEKIRGLEKVEKKNIKSISYQGKLEQQGIASRMYENFQPVFNHTKPVIHIAYTKEIRTLQYLFAIACTIKRFQHRQLFIFPVWCQ